MAAPPTWRLEPEISWPFYNLSLRTLLSLLQNHPMNLQLLRVVAEQGRFNKFPSSHFLTQTPQTAPHQLQIKPRLLYVALPGCCLPSTLTLLCSPKDYCPLVIPSCLAFTVHEGSSYFHTLACAISLSLNFLSHPLHLLYSCSSFNTQATSLPGDLPGTPRLAPFLSASAATVTNIYKSAHHPTESTLLSSLYCKHPMVRNRSFPSLIPQCLAVNFSEKRRLSF